MSRYLLIGHTGDPVESKEPGKFGGHSKLKIYGRLDCPSALRFLAAGHYKKHRVFFATEGDAVLAGYRPCSKCMREAYLAWRAGMR